MPDGVEVASPMRAYQATRLTTNWVRQLINVKTKDRKKTLMHVLIEMIASSPNSELLELQPCSLDELEAAQVGMTTLTLERERLE
jgi:hypothetical protein